MKKLKRLTHESLPHKARTRQYEFVVIGAGPAGILAVAALLKKGIPNEGILWIDPEFKVGSFGKQWASVPGNTEVGKYITVYQQIFAMIEKQYQASYDKELFLMINALKSKYACSLKAAAEPLQLMTNLMCGIVDSIAAMVININQIASGLSLLVADKQKEYSVYIASKVIIATGAEAKSVLIPSKESSKVLPLEIALSTENLQKFMENNPGRLIHVALIGSSHSAALATMNLIKADVRVTQFMNKEYRFASCVHDEKGIKRTQYDNTGLKGQVAHWTKLLLANQKRYACQWQVVKGDLDDLSKYSHIVSAIGLQAVDTLKINGKPSASLLSSYNRETTETGLAGIFVLGAGYPRQVRDFSGEIENNVGVTKFWPDFQCAVETWVKKPMLEPMGKTLSKL